MEKKIEEIPDFCTLAFFSARVIAKKIVDEKGQFHAFVGKVLVDPEIGGHQSNFLNHWSSLMKKVRRFSLPLCHKKAEEIVRVTMNLPATTSLTDAHVRQAVVCACLTPLRQTVGSCFATAPAIVAQRHHLEMFVDDLYELLTAGRLRRVVEGRQYTVPLSPSYGVGEIQKINALLKAWEFTLASLSDIKMEFAQWNLSWSLGLHPQEKGGIGEALYQALEAKLQETNEKIQEVHQGVLAAFDQVKMVERLLREASSEEQARRFKAEHIARLHHLRASEDLREELHQRAKAYAEFFNFFHAQLIARLQEYFQEIYDPEMVGQFTGPYEDRRAGFRLVFKHGRSDSSLWTFIHTADQFVKSFIEFFTLIEPYVAESRPEVKKIVEEMMTVAIQHVQTDRFISSCLARAEEKKRLPWAYLSGGTMDQLIPIYFRIPSPAKESREMHNELDLFTFLLETLKELSPKITDPFLQDPSRRLLIESPTHAFSILPGVEDFQKGWVDRGFTYTWIRDQFLNPAKAFYEEMKLSREMQLELMRRLSVRGNTMSSMSIEMFCRQFSERDLAPILARILPLIPAEKCKAVLQDLLIDKVDKIVLPSSLPPFMTSEEIQFLAKAQLSPDLDRQGLIANRARALNLAPKSCLFADTNWPEGYFAFVIHPISLELEVWKTDRAGAQGIPLPLVKSWFGKGKEFIWKLFTNNI